MPIQSSSDLESLPRTLPSPSPDFGISSRSKESSEPHRAKSSLSLKSMTREQPQFKTLELLLDTPQEQESSTCTKNIEMFQSAEPSPNSIKKWPQDTELPLTQSTSSQLKELKTRILRE